MSKQLEPIRIAVLAAHPAIRAGFEAIVGHEPDLELVGCAADEAELCPLLDCTNPQVVVLDPGHAALDLCFELKRREIAAAVVLYVPSLDDGLAVGAAVAGAGAIVGWASPTEELLEAIRTLGSRPSMVPEISPRARSEVLARLDPADYPIVAMRLAGEPATEIAWTLGSSSQAIQKRIARILARLQPIESAS
jgi:DNA-binding NarL/FixJ family response regulator